MYLDWTALLTDPLSTSMLRARLSAADDEEFRPRVEVIEDDEEEEGGGGDDGGGDGGGGDEGGDGGGGDGGGGGGDDFEQEIASAYEEVRSSGRTSRGESLDDQDQETQDMFRSVWGDEAGSRWAQEREEFYGESDNGFDSDRGGDDDFGRSRRAAFDEDERDMQQRSRQGPDLEALQRQRDLQTFETIRQNAEQARAVDTLPPPTSTPPMHADSSEGFAQQIDYAAAAPRAVDIPTPATTGPATPTAPGTTQTVATRAATAAAVEAKAAGATDEEAAITAASAATAAALALDKRSLVSESPETIRRFRETYGDSANAEWVRQHNQELRDNFRRYGSPEPRTGTPARVPGVGPAPERRIGVVPQVVGPSAAPGPGSAAPRPAARPGQPPVPAPVVAGQAPQTPEARALALDLQDVRAFTASPLGQRVNDNDPIEAALRVVNPNAVENGMVDPEFARNAARSIATDDIEGRGLLVPIAQMAWYRERVSKGEQPEAPEMAPAPYVDGWQKLWKSGGTAPLTTSLKQALHEYGFATPAEQARSGRARDITGTPEARQAEIAAAVNAPRATEIGSSATALADREDAETGELIRMAPAAVPSPPVAERGEPVLSGAIDRPDVEAQPIIMNGQRVPHPITRLGQEKLGAVGGMFETNPERPMGPSQSELHQGPLLSELRRPEGPYGRDTYAQEGQPLITQAYVRMGDRPLEAATWVQLAEESGSRALVQPGGDTQAATHLAHGIAAGEGWTTPALENIARLAYAEEKGDTPTNATQEYISSWIGAWQNGDAPPLSDKLDAQLWDQGIRTVPGTQQMAWQNVYGEDLSFNQTSFASAGLLSRQEALNACGPAALLSFMRASGGRTPTQEEALRLSRAVGWRGGAFPGPQNMVRAMRMAGLDVSDNERFDAVKVNAEIDAGRPVVIDTPGHYFVAYGRDAKTGQYLVGGSGEVLQNGSKWMTLPQMARAMGAPRDAIYLKSGNFVRQLAQPQGDIPRAPEPTAETGVVPPLSATSTVSAMTTPGEGAFNRYIPSGSAVDERSDQATNGTSPDEIEEYIRRAASARGIDPDQAYEVAVKEGSLNNQRVTNPVLRAVNGQPSWGPFQLHVEGRHLGDAYIRDTRNELTEALHPRDPKGWKLAVDYALDTVARDGDWHQWYGADRGNRQVLPNGRFTKVRAKPLGFSDEATYYAGVTRKAR